MKTKKILFVLLVAMITGSAVAQSQSEMQYARPNDKRGVNVFETSKEDTVGYDGVKVRVGGDFALQFQAIDHSNKDNTLVKLGSNFNLPAANLNIDAQLYDGLHMNLKTYLSSRHHNESWVKGGYLQIDKLDFIKEGFLEELMKVATIKVGLDEFSYGDAIHRRSDNARGIFNPFVGNYIMDSFSTEAFGEVTIQSNGFIGLVGLTNGKLNQNVVLNEGADNKLTFYGKLGYDKQIDDDLRLRLTASVYHNGGKTTGQYLYGGDRAGSRYFNVMADTAGAKTNFDGRFNPGFFQTTAFQVNPFVKFKGLEFFGIYEMVTGKIPPALQNSTLGEGEFTQIGAELLYRFGNDENFYVGGRYNKVSGKVAKQADEQEIDRLNVGLGWFMTRNILAKLEYVDQNYTGKGWEGSRFDKGNFKGVMFEAVISF